MYDVELEMEVIDFPDMEMGGVIDSYTKEQADKKFQEKLSEEQLQNIEDVQKKVAKEQGKGLSTNDYTTEEKQEVAKIVNKADVSYVKNTFANALKGTASGEVIAVTDVSPLEHTMDVKVRSKNLFNPIFDQEQHLWADEGINVAIRTSSGYSQIVKVKPNTTYTISGNFTGANSNYVRVAFTEEYPAVGVMTIDNRINTKIEGSTTFTTSSNCHYLLILTGTSSVYDYTSGKPQLKEGTTTTEYTPYVDVSKISLTRCGKNVVSIANKTISGDKGYASGTNSISLTPNTVYTVSADFAQTGSKATVGITVRDSSGVTIGKSNTTTDTNGRFSATFTSPEDGKIMIALFSNITATAITGTSCAYSNFQIEVGSSATEYEPYKEPTTHTPNADGTVDGVTSLYPTTTLLADTNGAVIDVEYNRDINKAFAELEQKLTNAVISLGGNV